MGNSIGKKQRPSGEKMLREMSDLTRALGLKAGETVFITGGAGEIDEGWSILRSDPNDPDKVRVSKVGSGENAADNPIVNYRELVRLNTGRNRGALEYVFKGGDTPERTALINAVDRADDDAPAREKLTEFFRKEALDKARKMLKGTPVKLEARTFEEMTEEISEHLHEAEDFQMKRFKEILARLEKTEKATKEAAAQGKTEERDVKDAEAAVADVRKNKRYFETQWQKDVQELLSLIDLAGQFRG